MADVDTLGLYYISQRLRGAGPPPEEGTCGRCRKVGVTQERGLLGVVVHSLTP